MQMQRPHPNYPHLLPRAALFGPLRPYPISWRNEITYRLQAGCGISISRAFLALCNLNLLEYAPLEDRNHIRRALQNSTDREITVLSQSLTVALREYLTIGGRTNSSAAASTVGAPTPPIGGRGCQGPCSLRETKPDIFQLLTYLAGPTAVENVTNYLLQVPTGQDRSGQTQINRLENLVCLSPNQHQEFGHGLFVLEPVGDPLAGLDPNGQLSEYEVRFSWVPQYRSRLPVPGDDEIQNDFENDHGADRDGAGEGDDQGDEELVVLQVEGDWDLTQVLDPGVPMEERRDPILVGREVRRLPRVIRRSGLRLQ
ncbi:hypothetical protein L211DRAFT_854689, partial [Terfezia boudieri ATCC MYA-4762]